MTQPEQFRRSPADLSLVRLGFTDLARAARAAAALGLRAGAGGAVVGAGVDGGVDALLEALAGSADPDLALVTLERLAEVLPAPGRAELFAGLARSAAFRARLAAVLGASAALGDHLVRHPWDWLLLADDDAAGSRPSALGLERSLLTSVGAHRGGTPATAVAADATAETMDALRICYRRHLLTLAARDLTGLLAVEDVAGELADLAAATLQAALAVARAELGADLARQARLAVVAMGKCGGRELNYVSDVDVVFVGEPAGGVEESLGLRVATRLAEGLIRVCSAVTKEGTIFPVDVGLRPEGKSGPLVRTLASHLAYYGQWARTWEFQALLKARPVAGDEELGRRYLAALAPLVWSAGEREGFVVDVQAMRRRVEESVPVHEADRNLKLGRGGLRDVEFAVQLLQLVHGRADETLRSPTTLSALAALAAGGYVGREDAAALARSYRFLRTAEHRLQLQRLRRTHTVPGDPRGLRWLARALGYRGDAVTAFQEQRVRHAVEVRRLHEKLFYRPLLDAVARLPAGAVRLSMEAAAERLEALGFRDTGGALRHIDALTSGVSRRAAIQRTLLPVMLGWFAQAADPDAGLLAFRQCSDALGDSPWYLRMLRDEGLAAERLARLLASSRYVADMLVRTPEAITLLGFNAQLRPRDYAELREEMLAVARRNDSEGAVRGVRAARRFELLRIACADLLGLLDPVSVERALTDIATATLVAAFDAASRKVSAEWRGFLPMRLAVIGMGRLGGAEMGYASDADVLFVYRPEHGVEEHDAAQAAHAVAEELRRLLALPAPDPPLLVDSGLRPEGKQGPLVRSLDSYAAYYARWSLPWEAQALLRASPVAGDEGVAEAFFGIVDPVRWPAEFGAESIREVRRLKARMEAERLPRGADKTLHLKLGSGGLSDVEWVAQLIQLQHAHAVPGLRTTATLEALKAAKQAGLMTAAELRVLVDGWTEASRLRNALMLVSGRPIESLPSSPASRELASVARAVGYPAGEQAVLLEDQRRRARRTRAVVDRLFYG